MDHFFVADVRREGFVDAPIPAENVLDGQPRARSCNLHDSHKGGVSMNLWDCTAGRFRWHYHGDELVHILEGEVHVTDGEGETQTLRPGDTAHFPAGSTLLWEVPEYVKKLATHRSPKSLPDRALQKVLRTLTAH